MRIAFYILGAFLVLASHAPAASDPAAVARICSPLLAAAAGETPGATPREVRAIHARLRELAERHGLAPSYLAERYSKLLGNRWLRRMMSGFQFLSSREATHTLFGGWGQDMMFFANRELWGTVGQSFAQIVRVYARKLGLGPDLLLDLTQTDQISLADSGWVIAKQVTRGRRSFWHPFGQATTTVGTVKVTFFDLTATPDGPWPRYAVAVPFRTELVPAYQSRDLPVGDGELQHRSSLVNWGLLPVERHSGRWRIPEHGDLFTPEFMLRHWLMMDEVVRASGHRQNAAHALADLMDFRQRTIPAAAFRVAELGRFTLPSNLSAQGKVQLHFGLLVLINSRPIDVVYLEAPVTKHDLLRKKYEEEYGFRIAKTFAPGELAGLPEGAYAMVSTRDSLNRKLISLLKAHGDLLSPDQLRYLEELDAPGR